MISLYDIIEASNGQLFGEPGAQVFSDFCLDAASATEDTLYLALKSDHGDTHQDIPRAVAAGAGGIVCSRPPECDTAGVSVVLVRDTTDALLAWARYIMGKSGVRAVGVAGSTATSVTVEAIRRVLALRYPVHADPDAGDGRLSIPLALARLNVGDKLVVLKMRPTQPGEMATMIQSVQPEVGVLTHLEQSSHTFETTERAAEAHRILVEYLSPAGLAVLNYDDDAVRAMTARSRATVRTIGIDAYGADMLAHNVVVGPERTGFDLRYGDQRLVGRWIPLLGRQFVYAALAALSVGTHFDIQPDEALKALVEMTPLAGRMNPLVGRGDSLLVDDTYNANPESTLMALDWLAAVQGDGARAIFVMGDMRAGRNGYRRVGQRVAQVADVFVAQGLDAAQAARAALDAGMDPRAVRTTYSPQDTITALIDSGDLRDTDTVLVKGDVAMAAVLRELLADQHDERHLFRHREGLTDKAFRPARPSWVELDTAAIAQNVCRLKEIVGPDVTLMAVVKANAYGHGAIPVSQTALLNGAEYLGVSSISEALELRDAGITAPVLVMSYTPVYLVAQAVQHDITLTLYDLDLARAYDRVARDMRSMLRVHLKLDTGMGRMGIMPDDAVSLFRHITEMKNLHVEGIYTHFSCADEDSDYTQTQLEAFRGVVRPLQATTGEKFTYMHGANSAATLAYPDAHFNMVRTGLALYGLHPSQHVPLPDGFRPALTWKTVIAQVKTLPPGHPVGYGNTYTTTGHERIAVIPVGYSEGFRRGPQHWAEVLVRGQRVPVVGRVSMEKTVLQVDAVPEVSIGDEVVLLGSQGGETITAEEVAAHLGTINYEVVTGITPLVPRRV